MGLIQKIKCFLGYHKVIISNEIIYLHRITGEPLTGQCIHCGKYGYVGIGK